MKLSDFSPDRIGESYSRLGIPLQDCPYCGKIIGALPGGRDAHCKNCGYKDPCCE